ncbi:thymidine phosphorylase [bacterium]|nr:thymidine phosphorylase [bacterium]
MKPVSEIIRKKREGQELLPDELEFLVKGFADGSIPDYQISAWLMASFLCGMSTSETLTLTTLMRNSGKTMNWRKMSSNFENEKFADKHSTGGVGDKVSLILAPLAVCFGMKVPMMSGRGLGHTGGTVDKLESIPGFTMYPTEAMMLKNLDEIGTIMMAQSNDLCPADKKLYSLRDVTATIESVPLITASIVSKKWAEGIDAIVYDVKCGSAAFMSDVGDAKRLSESLVKVSSQAGMASSAMITRMEEPLGSMIGNAMEVEESLWILSDEYPSELHRKICEPLKELCCDLTVEMAMLSGLQSDREKAKAEALKFISEKKALEVFSRMAVAQGAAKNFRDALPKAEFIMDITAEKDGTLAAIDSRSLGVIGLDIGVGRKRAEDPVDPKVGFEVLSQVGQKISKGDVLCRIHARDKAQAESIYAGVQQSFQMILPTTSVSTIGKQHLFIDRIRKENLE